MAKKVAKGTLYLFAAQSSMLVLRLVLIFFLARILGPAGYGQYSVVIAFCVIFEMMLRSGLTGGAIREIAAAPEKTYSLIRSAFILQLVWAFSLFFMISAGAGFWSRYVFRDPSLTSLLRIAPLYLVPLGMFCIGYSLLSAKREFGKAAFVQFFFGLMRTIVPLIFILIWADVPSVFFAVFTAAVLGLLPLLPVVRGLDRRKSDIDGRSMVFLAVSLLISAAAMRAVFQVDKIFLKGIIGDDSVVGIYALGSNFSMILQFLPISLATTLYPSIASSYARGDHEQSRKYLLEGTKYTALMIFPIALGMVFLGKEIIRFFFGSKFEGAYQPFTVLILAAVCFSFFVIYKQALVAVKRHWLNVALCLSVFFAAILFNPVLIGRYGLMGAAWATFAAAFIGALISGLLVFREFKTGYPRGSTARILLVIVLCITGSAVLMDAVFWVKCLAYLMMMLASGGLLFFLGELTEKEWSTLKGVFAGAPAKVTDGS